ncbi:MAG: S41 family peptidase [Candidatus Obscuribacterales bacterium]
MSSSNSSNMEFNPAGARVDASAQPIDFATIQKQNLAPLSLFQMAIRLAREYFFDTGRVADLERLASLCNSRIYTDKDAVRCANEVFAFLKDNFTRLLDSDLVAKQQETATGKFAGIGVSFGFKLDARGDLAKDEAGEILVAGDDEGYPVFEEIIEGGPAQKAGIHEGMSLVSVNGESTRHCTYMALLNRLRGPIGEKLTIQLRDQGIEETVTLYRATVLSSPVEFRMLHDEIGYVRLKDFVHQEAAARLALALASMRDARALIFDLRGNTGGSLHQACSIASFFLEAGAIASVKRRIPGDPAKPVYVTINVKVRKDAMVQEAISDQEPDKIHYNEQPRSNYLADHRPIAVLIDGSSASASELTAACLKENGVATIIGKRSLGKGIGQSILPMPNGCQLSVTDFRYYTPAGNWLGDGGENAIGIEPDIEVDPIKRFFKPLSEDDNQLARAVAVMMSRLATGSNQRVE